MENWAEETRQ